MQNKIKHSWETVKAYCKCMFNKHEKQIRLNKKMIEEKMSKRSCCQHTVFSYQRIILWYKRERKKTEENRKKSTNKERRGESCSHLRRVCCVVHVSGYLHAASSDQAMHCKKRNKRPSLSRNKCTEDLKTVRKSE